MSVGGPKRKLSAAALVAGALLLPAVISNLALAQTPTQASPEVAINLGGRGWSSPSSNVDETKRSADQFSFEARAGLRPTIYTAEQRCRITSRPLARPLKRRFPCFTRASPWPASSCRLSRRLRFPRAPVCARRLRISISISGQPTFLYPGETSVGGGEGTDYWEAAFRADKRIAEFIHVAGGFAYSPNVSNTGAWGCLCRGGRGRRGAGPVSSTGHCRVVHRWRRLFLVRQSIAGVGWLSLARLSELAIWRNVHAQGFQPGSALLRHQSLAGKLFRPDRRSECAAGRCHQPTSPTLRA